MHSEARAPIFGDAATTMPVESNPYVSPAPVPDPSSIKRFVCLENMWNLIWFLRYGGVGERCAWEMGEEGGGGNQEG
ncbi:hypothetical protein SO802_024038 [Lithocarpus litseifolius]|uniref:Uncharacterized protein n=1 Tax=Lithocarpus litseifolius TaxID=425828 RepID=A0AAW2CD75_9ROSI